MSLLPPVLLEVGDLIGAFFARDLEQADLRRERDFATQVMSVMGQGIAVTGIDGKIEYCNDAFDGVDLDEEIKAWFMHHFANAGGFGGFGFSFGRGRGGGGRRGGRK